MQIRVLGCWGGLTREHRTVGFLVNDRLLLDAGTAASALTVEEAAAVSDVVLSHAHIDHIKELPFLVAERTPGDPLRVHGTARVLAHVRRHVFNGQIWPDFTILPSREKPQLAFHKLSTGARSEIAGIGITPVSVTHSVVCTGMLIDDGGSAIAWTSDTGPTEKIWRAARARKVRAILVEVSFPNGMGGLARISGHLTVNLLLAELRKLDMPGVPLYVYHMKPQYAEEIRSELLAIKNPVIPLEQGHTYEF